jgi:hypothetical protein
MDIKLRRKGWSVVLIALLLITAVVPVVEAAECGAGGAGRVAAAANSCPVSPAVRMSGGNLANCFNNLCSGSLNNGCGISTQVKDLETLLGSLGCNLGAADGQINLENCKNLFQSLCNARLPGACQ